MGLTENSSKAEAKRLNKVKNKSDVFTKKDVRAFKVVDFDENDNETTLLDLNHGLPVIAFANTPLIPGSFVVGYFTENPASNPAGVKFYLSKLEQPKRNSKGFATT